MASIEYLNIKHKLFIGKNAITGGEASRLSVSFYQLPVLEVRNVTSRVFTKCSYVMPC